MHITTAGRASSTVLAPPFATYKPAPTSHPFLHRNQDDIYLNIDMPPISHPSQQNTLKSFNRKLEHSLKERQMQQLIDNHNNRLPNRSTRRPWAPPKNKTYESQKILVIDDDGKPQTKSLASLIKNQASPKKYSLDTKYETTAKRSILEIPSIREDALQEKWMLENLIGSQSSKGLLKRLLKRKKQAIQQQQQTLKCIFRYPLNRRNQIKTARKMHSIKAEKLIIKFHQNNPEHTPKSPQNSPIKLPYNRMTHYRNKDLILSPSKQKPSPGNHQHRLSFCDKSRKAKACGYDRDSIGPWQLQGSVPFDI